MGFCSEFGVQGYQKWSGKVGRVRKRRIGNLPQIRNGDVFERKWKRMDGVGESRYPWVCERKAEGL